jgi:hypothetical protein
MKKYAVFLLAVGSLLAASRAAEPAPVVSVLENNLLRVRVRRVTEFFSEQIRAAEPTNKISGTILDLRFADGDNAAAAVDYYSQKKSPLVILVNSETRGSAATLVTQLRAAGGAVVIGNTNAAGILQPDIAVAIGTEAERKFQENPFAEIAADKPAALSATNDLLPFIDHMSEAELVRNHVKDGEDDGIQPTTRTEPPPVIRDPALARAVDLLKALAIVRPARG